MIDFNQNDFNLTKVRHESKLANLITRQKYRIYGLRQAENPPVLIEYDGENVTEDFGKRLNVLVKYFKANGIEVETFDGSETQRVDVGLRKDLRAIVNQQEQPLFAASILSTIIYCLEGRIDLEQMAKYKLANIPKLPVRVTEQETT